MNCSNSQFFFTGKKQLLFITLGSNISLAQLGNHQLCLMKLKFLRAWLTPRRKSSWVMQWITGRRISGNTAEDKGWRKCSGKLNFGPSRSWLLLFHSPGRDFWQLGSKSFLLPSKWKAMCSPWHVSLRGRSGRVSAKRSSSISFWQGLHSWDTLTAGAKSI